MAPDFALSLSLDGLRLLQRDDAGWLLVGDVSLQTPHLRTALAELRARGEALAGGPFETKVLIPNDQIRYLTLETPEADESAVRRALEGATPYPVEDLVFDFISAGGKTHVAAVARETLDEAESFAREHGLSPVSFAGAPKPFTYAGEAVFGPASGHHGPVTRDPDPVHVVGVARLPNGAPAHVAPGEFGALAPGAADDGRAAHDADEGGDAADSMAEGARPDPAELAPGETPSAAPGPEAEQPGAAPADDVPGSDVPGASAPAGPAEPAPEPSQAGPAGADDAGADDAASLSPGAAEADRNDAAGALTPGAADAGRKDARDNARAGSDETPDEETPDDETPAEPSARDGETRAEETAEQRPDVTAMAGGDAASPSGHAAPGTASRALPGAHDEDDDGDGDAVEPAADSNDGSAEEGGSADRDVAALPLDGADLAQTGGVSDREPLGASPPEPEQQTDDPEQGSAIPTGLTGERDSGHTFPHGAGARRTGSRFAGPRNLDPGEPESGATFEALVTDAQAPPHDATEAGGRGAGQTAEDSAATTGAGPDLSADRRAAEETAGGADAPALFVSHRREMPWADRPGEQSRIEPTLSFRRSANLPPAVDLAPPLEAATEPDPEHSGGDAGNPARNPAGTGTGAPTAANDVPERRGTEDAEGMARTGGPEIPPPPPRAEIPALERAEPPPPRRVPPPVDAEPGGPSAPKLSDGAADFQSRLRARLAARDDGDGGGDARDLQPLPSTIPRPAFLDELPDPARAAKRRKKRSWRDAFRSAATENDETAWKAAAETAPPAGAASRTAGARSGKPLAFAPAGDAPAGASSSATGQDKIGQDKIGQDETGQDEVSPATWDPARSDQAAHDRAELTQAERTQAGPEQGGTPARTPGAVPSTSAEAGPVGMEAKPAQQTGEAAAAAKAALPAATTDPKPSARTEPASRPASVRSTAAPAPPRAATSADERERLTIFGARQTELDRRRHGAPWYLGLLLTVMLIVLLAVAGALAAVGTDGLSRLLGRDDAVADAPAPAAEGPATPLIDVPASLDAATGEGDAVAAPTGPERQPDFAAATAPPPGDETAADDIPSSAPSQSQSQSQSQSPSPSPSPPSARDGASVETALVEPRSPGAGAASGPGGLSDVAGAPPAAATPPGPIAPEAQGTSPAAPHVASAAPSPPAGDPDQPGAASGAETASTGTATTDNPATQQPATQPAAQPAPAPAAQPATAPIGRVLSPAEAQRIYAATGVWQRAPRIPVTPRPEQQADLDEVPVDAWQPPQSRTAPDFDLAASSDTPIPTPVDPPPPGTVFERDENGFILATDAGTRTPDGIVIYAGSPDSEPPIRPGTEPPPFDPTDLLAGNPAPDLALDVANGAVVVAGLPEPLPPTRPGSVAPGGPDAPQGAATTQTGAADVGTAAAEIDAASVAPAAPDLSSFVAGVSDAIAAETGPGGTGTDGDGVQGATLSTLGPAPAADAAPVRPAETAPVPETDVARAAQPTLLETLPARPPSRPAPELAAPAPAAEAPPDIVPAPEAEPPRLALLDALPVRPPLRPAPEAVAPAAESPPVQTPEAEPPRFTLLDALPVRPPLRPAPEAAAPELAATDTAATAGDARGPASSDPVSMPLARLEQLPARPPARPEASPAPLPAESAENASSGTDSPAVTARSAQQVRVLGALPARPPLRPAPQPGPGDAEVQAAETAPAATAPESAVPQQVPVLPATPPTRPVPAFDQGATEPPPAAPPTRAGSDPATEPLAPADIDIPDFAFIDRIAFRAPVRPGSAVQAAPGTGSGTDGQSGPEALPASAAPVSPPAGRTDTAAAAQGAGTDRAAERPGDVRFLDQIAVSPPVRPEQSAGGQSTVQSTEQAAASGDGPPAARPPARPASVSEAVIAAIGAERLAGQDADPDADAAGAPATEREGLVSPGGVSLDGVSPPIRPEDTVAETALASGETGNTGPRPRPRPEGLAPESPGAEAQEAPQSDGVTNAEIVAALAAAATTIESSVPATATATPQAVALSPRPDARPRNMDQLVRQARTETARRQTAAAAPQQAAQQQAPAAPTAVQPSGPTATSVAQAATLQRAINLSRINLIGVYGPQTDRHALVRLANGRYVRVGVGDRLDGGQVRGIGDSFITYTQGGRNLRLDVPG